MKRRPGRDGVMRIEVYKGHGTRYRSTLRRADGVVVALEGSSWNRIGGPVTRVPHDLTHLVVEQQLGLTRGLWGVLAAGGLVQNAAFVGRRPLDGRAVAKRITDAAGEELRQAEVLVRALAEATLPHGPKTREALRRMVGDRWWHPRLDAGAVAAMDAALRAEALAWDALAPDATLARAWHPSHPR